MTYEEQVKKWAVNYYPDLKDLNPSTVTLSETVIYGGYCETCRYEDDAWIVKAFDESGKEIWTETTPDYMFSNLLKQIIEA